MIKTTEEIIESLINNSISNQQEFKKLYKKQYEADLKSLKQQDQIFLLQDSIQHLKNMITELCACHQDIKEMDAHSAAFEDIFQIIKDEQKII
jgi:hypothetical protein